MRAFDNPISSWFFSSVLCDLQDLKAQNMQMLQVQAQNMDALAQRIGHMDEYIGALGQQMARIAACLDQLDQRIANSEERAEENQERMEALIEGQSILLGKKVADSWTLLQNQLHLLEQEIADSRAEAAGGQEQLRMQTNAMDQRLAQSTAEAATERAQLAELLQGCRGEFDCWSRELQTRQAQIEERVNESVPRIASLSASIERIEHQVLAYGEQISSINTVQGQSMEHMQKIDGRIQDLGNLHTGKYTISETRRFPKDFVWVTNRDAEDMISQYVHQGFCGQTPWDYSGEEFWNLFQKPGTFLDLGANIGAFCFPLAQAGWKGFAVEASERNADVLRKSILLNEFDIQVCEKAVHEKTGTVYFFQDGPQGYVQDHVHGDKPYEEIEAVALDEYRKDPVLQQITSVDLVKMDIEGSEPAALRGMKQFLKEMGYPVVYSEVNVWNLFCMGESQRRFFEQFIELGYTPFQLKDGGLYQIPLDYLPEIPCTDYFFLPEDCGLKEHIRGSVQQNGQDVRYACVQTLKDMKAYLGAGRREEEPILPHIALYSYIEDYPAFAADPQIRQLRAEIAELLSGTENAVYQKMMRKE